MSPYEALFLGILQGITEFLPISSSGHLILGRSFFGGIENASSLAFDVLLHLVTALVICIYFRKDIISIFTRGPRAWFVILVGIIPAGLVGFFFEDVISETFRSVNSVIVMLILGALLMALGEFVLKRRPYISEALVPRLPQVIVMGLFQVLALIPGTSRSGSTIAGGLIAGLSREAAARFSFILGLPIILGAGLVKVIDGIKNPVIDMNIGAFITGGIFTFISGLLAVHILMKIVSQKSLWPFIWYRIALALTLIIFII